MALTPTKHVSTAGTVSWRLRVDLGPDPVTGARRRQWVTRPTEKACRAAAIELLEKQRRGLAVRRDGLTVREYMPRFQAYEAGHTRKATQMALASCTRTHILPYFGAMRLQDVSELEVAAWRDWLRDEQGLSERSVKTYQLAFGRALDQARRWQLIERNPVREVRPPKIEAAEPGHLSAAQVARLLKAAQGHHYEVYFLLGFATGLRQGELLGAVWDDCDFAYGEHGAIRVREQLSRHADGGMKRGPTKTARSVRVVPLPPGVAAALRVFRARDAERRLKRPGWNPERLIVTNTVGQHAWPAGVNIQIAPLCLKAGIPLFASHDMRHTYASLLAASGIPESVVQALLGHTSGKMTRHYTHTYAGHLTTAAAALGDLFDGPQNFRPTGGPLGDGLAENGIRDEAPKKGQATRQTGS